MCHHSQGLAPKRALLQRPLLRRGLAAINVLMQRVNGKVQRRVLRRPGGAAPVVIGSHLFHGDQAAHVARREHLQPTAILMLDNRSSTGGGGNLLQPAHAGLAQRTAGRMPYCSHHSVRAVRCKGHRHTSRSRSTHGWAHATLQPPQRAHRMLQKAQTNICQPMLQCMQSWPSPESVSAEIRAMASVPARCC